MVSLTAVQVCVQNAERLLEDATKTSGPTASALAELSIEESAKAWMLYFRLLFQGRGPRIRARIPRKKLLRVGEYLQQHRDYLSRLDREIAAAFRYHKVKLKFLAFLLGYLEVALPIFEEAERFKGIAEALHGPAFNVKELGVGVNVERLGKLLGSFRKEGLTALDQVKLRGFYVNMSEKGDLVSPSIEAFEPAPLGALAGFLVVSLKGELLLLTK